MNAEQRTPVTATSPAELVTLFTAHLNDGNVEALVEFYDEDGSFSPQEGVVVTGTDAIREALMGFTAMQPTVTCDVKWVQQVGSFALVLNDWTIDGRQPDGEAVSMTGRSTDVVRCGEDGGWRFYIDCVWGGS
jgi:uncharacterized protein (TIGR02246 family)